jgi:hypothetical protein
MGAVLKSIDRPFVEEEIKKLRLIEFIPIWNVNSKEGAHHVPNPADQ